MAKNWIAFPKSDGEHSRQAHADFPEGTYEREMGREGFFGPATHFYHENQPTGWSSFEGPLQPRAFDTTKFTHDSSCPWQRKVILKNNSTQIATWSLEDKMQTLARNADGDQLLFVHNGTGDLFCDWGHMSYTEGDYIVLPRNTMWRLEPSEKTDLLMVEATNGAYLLPDKGMMGPHAVFDPGMLDVPEINEQFKDQQTDDEWAVHVKARDQHSTITYPFNPLDARGWKGNNVPVKVNWRDIRPLMSHRYHVPPSAHTTFVANRFVVCTFVPRPFETDPGALKVPFFHNNDDYDEFLFYHQGKFFSRDNIHPGMTTYHPTGFTHGPHPKSLKNADSLAGKETNEVAVMVDTRDALNVTEDASSVEWTDYVNSWKEK